ncbi:MAG: hypothetical protein LBE06_10860 [Azoarcus sp.]|jgi:hypothetical protein|nr:hypothetical protein [Azoarcus sp.]
MKNQPARSRRSVSASELAQMGVCEQRVLCEHLYGKPRTVQQRADAARGDEEHRRFYEARKGRCFIATLVYGESREVMVLRSFRDRVLRASPMGRGLILAYYRIAPGVCKVLAERPRLIRIVRGLLRLLVWGAERMTKDGGARDV